jgi:hypothetical protein
MRINPEWFKAGVLDKSRLQKLVTEEFQALKLGVPVALDADGYVKVLEETDEVYQGFLFSDAATDYLYPNSAIASGLVPVVTGGGIVELDADYFFGAAAGVINAGKLLYLGTDPIILTTTAGDLAPIGVTVEKRAASDAVVRVKLFGTTVLPLPETE